MQYVAVRAAAFTSKFHAPRYKTVTFRCAYTEYIQSLDKTHELLNSKSPAEMVDLLPRDPPNNVRDQ